MVLVLLSFVIGVVVSNSREVEVIKEVEVVKEIEVPVVKEVEEIVYRDNQSTIDELNLCNTTVGLLSEGYITMFDIAKEYAGIYGSPIHQDWYDLRELAVLNL